MEIVEKQFEALLEKVKNGQVSKQPSQQDKLKLYAWYKQAKEGDAHGERPDDFVGGLKYDAWAKLKGMDKAAAMQAYIDYFDAG